MDHLGGDEVEHVIQEVEERAWTTLRALCQEYGQDDPSTLHDRDQQLLWMGIKAGASATAETMRNLR